MTPQQQIFALSASVAIFFTIILLVKNKKLKEEYSWLWLSTGILIFLLAVWYDALIILTKLIGAITPTTTIFIFAILFLILVCLHFAIKISTLTDQVKNLAQELSILESQKKVSSEVNKRHAAEAR